MRPVSSLLMALALLPLVGRATPALPLKVFILAGQSNMEGQAVVDLDGKDYNDGRGTLVDVLRDPAKQARFKHLRDDSGRWATRDDVWVRYRPENHPLLKGPLGPGFSVYGDRHHFGPELQFGHVVGDAYRNQVLLIKTAWGGKSLYRDFRPPSSGGAVGAYYTRMIAEVREALANLEAEFPSYDRGGYELAGLVWYQGWNDGVDPRHAIPEYETNLVNLIRDVRQELGVPQLPVVIGELTGPWVDAPPEWTALRRAQAAAARHPEFAGNALFVETRHSVRKPEDSPNPTHGHHEFGNAETYLLVGNALAKGMVALADPRLPGYQTQVLEGWRVHLSDRLLADQREATDAMISLLRAQLREIVREVPEAALRQLRAVPLWFSPEYPAIPGKAEYHPSGGWLRANGRNPAMAKSVEVTNVRTFAQEMNRMPNFMLHELAHAYHDRVLGFEHRKIQAAFEQAKSSGRYDRVERWHGNGRPNTQERAYAMTDAKEYFAELTEAYFSRNDFYPFTRDELAKHDPDMFVLLLRLWGLRKPE